MRMHARLRSARPGFLLRIDVAAVDDKHQPKGFPIVSNIKFVAELLGHSATGGLSETQNQPFAAVRVAAEPGCVS